ncbi:hypothetical protein [Massilia sp. TS11]|uniref:hypothetical protein n=1 Tax=Massilia sp. TS11 TaxID=2908003 RepID=UPI001EDC3B81|nr:hypothetical protein [Massilia sp. TS11]MCG2583848.1 hypothetical protein [Massilia sp. TS11]
MTLDDVKEELSNQGIAPLRGLKGGGFCNESEEYEFNKLRIRLGADRGQVFVDVFLASAGQWFDLPLLMHVMNQGQGDDIPISDQVEFLLTQCNELVAFVSEPSSLLTVSSAGRERFMRRRESRRQEKPER